MRAEARDTEGVVRRVAAWLRARPRLCLALVAAIVVAIMLLWPAIYRSDRLKVEKTIEALGRRLTAGDAAGVLALVSPYFAEEGIYKERLRKELERILRNRPILGLRLVVRQLGVRQGQASALVFAESRHRMGIGPGTARSQWILRFEKIDGRWLMRSATPQSLNGDRPIEPQPPGECQPDSSLLRMLHPRASGSQHRAESVALSTCITGC